jgi:hypothetical protein
VLVRLHGFVTDEELLAHPTRLEQDPEFSLGYWQLYDLRDANLAAVSTVCVEALAASKEFASGARTALVADTESAEELAGVLQTHAGGGVRVFRAIGHALTWLELE